MLHLFVFLKCIYWIDKIVEIAYLIFTKPSIVYKSRHYYKLLVNQFGLIRDTIKSTVAVTGIKKWLSILEMVLRPPDVKSANRPFKNFAWLVKQFYFKKVMKCTVRPRSSDLCLYSNFLYNIGHYFLDRRYYIVFIYPLSYI